MGLLSVLQSAVRGTKQIPPFMNAATHEPDQEFVYDQIPSMPYSGQVTPDGPVHDMDFGGGSSAQPVAVKQHVSNRPNGFGKFLQKVPGILNAGIAAGATPNIAGGGMTDVFRAANSGVHTLQAHQDKERELARQKEQDSFRREVQKAQIDTIQAQAAQRRAKAAEGAELPEAKAIGTFGWYDRVGKWHDAPVKPDAKAADTKANRDYRIGNAGGYELPESKTFNVPTGSPVPGQETMQSTVSNVPPPEGYNNLPGTSGEHRVVMPSAETKSDLRHPDPVPKASPVHYIEGKDGRTTAVRLDAEGNPVEVEIKALGKGQKPAAAKKTLAETIAERDAAAAAQNLQGDDLKFYRANGRLPTGRAPKANLVDLIKSVNGALGGNTKPSVPAATPKQAGAQLPPEIVAKLPVGKNTRLKAPDGTEQMWVKSPDGTVKRLR